ncbi:MAG: hypothetical protein COU06_00525 [Candidatus Harrisonbacteria bacterium CG10_big_fil_rev_8_21_14_0_10_38_8]|uniref:POTRA domain-containing protein n=1 Tax=Candidatus Harrisonbacteria bacterium CG10_big_fil_rev_8_21_14_0_10_38_8 TaxID=1974582 RepID=A0A2M6WKL8_9BACT|nr:MAG: hypothetical protein COU06_00525 [Candidatus Harrisonbacteria bacterium CG10_big_fil_rev_8_21_14_0_10_38_8]
MKPNYYNKKELGKKKKNRRVSFYIYSTFILTLILGSSYLVIQSPLLKVNLLVSEDILMQVRPTLLEKKTSAVLGLNNYLSWSAISLPAFKKVNIDRDLKRKNILITTTPYEKNLVWCTTSNDCYWVDKKTGVPFSKAPQTRGQYIYTITEETKLSIIPNYQILPEVKFKYIISILDNIQENKISVDKIELNRNLEELRVITTTNTSLIFTLRIDPEELILDALTEVLKKHNLEDLEYINLTVENRVFYRNK